ncbi:MAG: Flp pilus assembly protein CpaB [Lachnospiraceae bacterium]|nr:Flp pilus assembly protein CpaB [Lachnospiraceae bacterium]
MKFLKNRTVLGVVCIALALVICFAITPLFNASKSSTMKIVRVKSDLKIGQEISSKDIEVVEVGAYNMPNDVLQKSEDVVGKYAAAEMIKGECVLAAKVSDTPASENAYLYGLTGEKRAISITIPSFAGGLSGKLISGDIVSIIAVDYKEQGETIVPEELQYVEVIAVTDSKGNDDETVTVKPDGEEETELPETLTLLVTPMQANILAELEAEGEIHVALVYRGTVENAQKFISAQEKYLQEVALNQENEKQENSGAPEIPQTPSESEIAEDNRAEENSDENNSGIETVIIDPEDNSENNSDNNSEGNSDNTETEVTSDAESV